MLAIPYIVNGIPLPLMLLSLRYSNYQYLKLKEKHQQIFIKISSLNKGVEVINVTLIFHDSSVNSCLLNDIKFGDPPVVFSLIIEKKTY